MSLCVKIGESVVQQFDADDLAVAAEFPANCDGAEIVHVESGGVLARWGLPDGMDNGGWHLTVEGEAFGCSGSETSL